MKKKPILFFLLAAVSTLSVSAAACKHTHKYDGYGSDSTGHWQQCTKCDEKTETEAHVDADKNNKCDVCDWDMPVINVPVTGVTLNKNALTLEVGGEETLTATVAPEGATDKTVVWSSSDELVATVANGKVTALKAGTATIKAACGGKEALCELTVTAAATYTVTFDMKGHGEPIESIETVKGTITEPAQPTAGGYVFGGWYTDENCTTPFDFETVIEQDLTLYAKWSEHTHDYDKANWAFDSKVHYHACKLDGCSARTDEAEHSLNENLVCTVCGVQLKDATFELQPSELEAKTYAQEFKVGIFSLLPDTTIRNRARENQQVFDLEGNVVAEGFTASKSVQYNGTKRGISVYAPAAGKLTLYLDNGSSGLTEDQFQKIILTKPDGTEQEISYPAKKLRRVELQFETEGQYKITRGSNGTTDIYYAKFEARVPVTPIEDIQISDPGKVEYLIGQEFDASTLQVQLVYSITQMVEPVLVNDSHLKIDYSAFDNTKAGNYVIKVTYTDDENNVFEAAYDVSVYDVEAIELGFNKIVQGNDGYNGIYVNKSVRQLYFVGDALNFDGLTVKTVFNGGKQKNIVTEGYSILTDDVDMSTAGLKKVTVRWGESTTIVAEFNIYVMLKPVEAGETLTVNVSAAYDDAQIGTVVEGAYLFGTIKQALDFIEGLELDQNVKKVINLAEGTYAEKVEINVPNLTIKGSADAKKTIIEWDALYGEVDESGFTHTTDSTSTLNVRRDATGFTIEGVTISNKWNSTEYFDEQKGPKFNEHRALALLVQADKVVIDNCRLLGYQDTVEFFTGRQYVKNSYIQGRTDFIFGTNNTTYFENCEIRSIVATGYITAFKGMNTEGSDVLYGAIFDKCRFTAPDDVTAAKDTAIGRPWGAYAAVAVINSELGGHISVTEYSGKAAGERYVTMNNCKPTDATVKFVEYNNTGAGAITTQQKGMTMLDAATAVNYSDISKIFGKQNGKVTYTSDWDGSKGVTITEFNYKFGDYYTANDGYTYHETPAEGEEFFGELATVKGQWGHELNQGKNQAKFAVGATIRFNVEGEVTITAYGGDYGKPENFKINYINGKAVITVVATETSPVKNGAYITLITLDKSKQGEHRHEYGEWQITAPTQTAKGSAERVCLDCELASPDKNTVTLPELSEDNYVISAGSAAGKSVYTYTDATYGKIVFETDSLAGLHVHDYGAWVVTATLEAAGTATKTCNGTEGECDLPTVTKNIPALTDAAYTVTNNTAQLDVAGEGDYSITVDGEEITFHAETAALTLTRITEDFEYVYGGSGDPVSTDKILFTNCGNSGGWVLYGKNGTITLNLPEGATLTFKRSPYENAEKVAINGELQEGGKEAQITYLVKVPGYVVISADNSAYLKSVSVEVDPNYQHKHTFGDWDITAVPSTEAEGSATRACRVHDCGVDGAVQNVTLPVLSVENYTIKASQNEGKSVYTLKSEEYENLSFEADSLPDVHVHDYGEWQVTKPEADTEGLAVKHCGGAGTCPDGDIQVTLPALSSDKYVITGNTATLEAAGEGTYTYTDETHGAISFTAATPKYEPALIDSNSAINIGSIKEQIEGSIYNFNGVIIDARNGKVRPNNGSVQLNVGTIIVLKVADGAEIGFTWYGDAKYGTDANANVVIQDGIATITIQEDPLGVGGSSGIYLKSISVKYGIKEITESGIYYNHSTDKANSNSYILIEGDCYDNGSYLCFTNGTITLKVAAGATIKVSGGYYNDEQGWGLYSAYEEGSDTPLTDTLADNGSSFTVQNGGTIIIKKADTASKSSLTTIEVTFPVEA